MKVGVLPELPDLLQHAITIVDARLPDQPVVYCNAAFERLTGYTSAEVVGRNMRLLQGPDPEPEARATLRAAIAAGESCKVVIRNYRKDGSAFWSEVRITPICDAAGAVTHFVGEQSDVTDREESLRALRDSEARFRAVLEAAPDATLLADSEGRIILVNERLEQLFGYPRAELLGESVDKLIPPDLRATHGAHIAQYIGAPRARMMGAGRQLFACRKDGSSFAADISLNSMTQGTEVVVLAAIRDVTDRREAEAQLRHQATLLNLARDAIIERGLDRRIRFWNDGAARLYGWSREEALGRVSVDLLVPGPERDRFETVWKGVTQYGEWHGDLHYTRRDGHKLIVETHWTLVRDAAGQPTAALSIDTDVTERRALETQALRNQRMESLGTMAGGITHDLNNVFQPIRLATELLRDELSDPQQLALVDLLDSSARRGAELVGQVLTFARGAAVERSPVRLERVVEDALQVVCKTCPKHITISTEWADDIWTVSADATQLHQVIMNLCLNSVDALPHGGVITVGIENREIDEQFARMHLDAATGAHVALRVTDNGTGMSAETRDRIFEPFFTTKGLEKGTGLGLATVYGIVKGHGGFITVYSEPGAGTSFTVFLPASGDTAVSMETTAEHRAQLADLAGHGELVLVVDDEEPIREVTRATLEKHGYGVLTAADGVKALALFADAGHQIAVVLTDLMMPTMSGDVLIDVVRELNPAVKVIAMSGLARDHGRATNVTSPSMRFLRKPFSAEELLEALAGLLRP